MAGGAVLVGRRPAPPVPPAPPEVASDRPPPEAGECDLSHLREGQKYTYQMVASEVEMQQIWEVIEIREAPLGPITLSGEGDQGAFSMVLPPGTWGISSRPFLDAGALDTYQQAEKQRNDGDPAGAVERLLTLAGAPGTTATQGAWYLHPAALWQGEAGNWEASDALFEAQESIIERGAGLYDGDQSSHDQQ